MAFDWDRPITISDRALNALDLMREAIERYGTKSQTLWPLVSSALKPRFKFLAGDAGDTNPLIITYDVRVGCQHPHLSC